MYRSYLKIFSQILFPKVVSDKFAPAQKTDNLMTGWFCGLILSGIRS
jgi:hypothetical protein